jgi:hypothetical protein
MIILGTEGFNPNLFAPNSSQISIQLYGWSTGYSDNYYTTEEQPTINSILYIDYQGTIEIADGDIIESVDGNTLTCSYISHGFKEYFTLTRDATKDTIIDYIPE